MILFEIEEETKICHLLFHSSEGGIAELDQAKARSLHLGLLCGCRRADMWAVFPVASPGTRVVSWIGAGLEVEHLGFQLVSIQDGGIADRTSTCTKMLTPVFDFETQL